MKWRFIPFQYYNPYFKTGLNKAIIESISKVADPVVFLSGWDKKTINLGYSQKVAEEVNMEEFEKRDDVVLVRRQGGGGTTFLTPGGEITWGMVAPEDFFPGDVNKIYEKVCGKIAEALSEIGIEAEHEPINDVVTDEGKISGATVKRKNGAVYVGGTLLYEVDAEEMFSLLTPSEDKKKDKQIEDYRERVSSLQKESDASFEKVQEILKKALLGDKNHEEKKWNQREIERAEELANKYKRDDWVYRE